MNVIVVSPDFPHANVNLCQAMATAGMRVLGLGDAAYDNLDYRLRESLTEYYKVDTLDKYEQVYSGVAYFAHRYGKPTIIESNNPYWLALDGLLREDFNVPGARLEGTDQATMSALLRDGFQPATGEGRVYSWEALVDEHGKVVREGVTRWPSTSRADYSYRTAPLSGEMADLGRDVVNSLGVTSTFVHLQVCEGKIVRVSLTPPPAFTLDMLNYSQSTDIFAAHATVLAHLDPNLVQPDLDDPEPARICVYASRQHDGDYALSSAQVEETWGENIVHAAENPVQYREGMGDWFYMALVDSDEEADRFAEDVTRRA